MTDVCLFLFLKLNKCEVKENVALAAYKYYIVIIIWKKSMDSHTQIVFIFHSCFHLPPMTWNWKITLFSMSQAKA